MKKKILSVLILLLIFSCTKKTPEEPPQQGDNKITLTYPTSGLLFYQDSTYTVRWMKEGNVNNVSLFYRVDDDSGWIIIDSAISELNYQWTIPQIRTNHAKVKVQWDSDTSVLDTNTGYFIIDKYSDMDYAFLICDTFFYMGSNDPAHLQDEEPIHKLNLSAYKISKTEVLNTSYRNFCNANNYQYPQDPQFPTMPNYFDSFPNHPVVMVSWYDAARYCNWRSEVDGYETQYDTTTWECKFTYGYRLPTEAEWEFACRAGLYQNLYTWGNETPGILCNWKDDELYEYTSPVRSFSANNYDIYDMTGNVWEWCNDYYDKDYYSVSPTVDPHGPDSGFYKVMRGGSWQDEESNIRCAKRAQNDPDFSAPDIKAWTLGFRIVLGF